MAGWVYIMANRMRGTLYIGVTSDLPRRAYEHREGLTPGFASRHGCRRLVWTEEFPTITEAISREKSLKKWTRAWKLALVERDNPHWTDLFDTLNM
ncbi:GIY-YIG nuclease family protein [Methylobrevis pamukkalensis]|uniref:GIY-YIG nuclease superfamily protein n=1 Tax=Methylobrevis pamukkalensis TaxID=1439726 RepID=A0A1E3H5Y3_9HYPH|nr:GIY-YIG nuclease family protein [Methylobrevis pamukkalensis]ODN71555.1 GIY-YIG nuclease superfamily protein [Methylobrevis pamukkalensis]